MPEKDEYTGYDEIDKQVDGKWIIMQWTCSKHTMYMQLTSNEHAMNI